MCANFGLVSRRRRVRHTSSMFTYCQHLDREMTVAGTALPFDRVQVTHVCRQP